MKVKGASRLVPIISVVAVLGLQILIFVLLGVGAPPTYNRDPRILDIALVESRSSAHYSSYTCYEGPHELYTQRTCSFSNLCYDSSSHLLLYFSNNTEESFPTEFINLRRYEPGRGLRPWHPTVVRGMEMPQRPFFQSWDTVAVILEPYWPENFGHALIDDFAAAFRMLHAVGVDPDVRDAAFVVLEPGCHKGSPEEQKRACKFYDQMWRGFVDAPPTVLNISITGPAALPASEVHEDSLQCFSNAVLGASDLNLLHSDERLVQFIERFIRKIDGSLWQKYVQPFEAERAAVLLKEGRRAIVNAEEIANAIERRMGIPADVISVNRLASMTLVEQIDLIMDYSLVVTPGGGASFITLFMKRGSCGLYSSFLNVNSNSTGIFEEFVWRRDYRRKTFTVPITREDVVFDPSHLDAYNSKTLQFADTEWNLFRNYGSLKLKIDVAIDLAKSCSAFTRLRTGLPHA